MDKEKKPAKRPDVLKKLNTENLLLIERGLLGDLPDRLKPNYTPKEPVRGQSTDLVVAKPSGFLSSCLSVPIPDSPVSEKQVSFDNEAPLSESPLKKSLSFRDKLSRISFLGKKEKEKTKWKTIVEDEVTKDYGMPQIVEPQTYDKEDDLKAKRFWFFRNKEIEKKQGSRPVYKRSKSFEFLPRALSYGNEDAEKPKKILTSRQSFVFGSTDSMGDAWTSNESLEFQSNVYYEDDDHVFLKSFKEISPDSSKHNSSQSTVSSAPSGLVTNIFNRDSLQNLLEEFEKTVELFTESYMSDSEPYTKTNKVAVKVKEKRKSSSFSTLQSPKVLQVPKVDKISEEFKNELSQILSERNSMQLSGVRSDKYSRRGSVTDWFVLEDLGVGGPAEVNKYRRAQKKPHNRVRRMSSTKYWITPEEYSVYSREQRPPLVIPRIREFRPQQRRNAPLAYHEESSKYETLQEWSPTSERSKGDIESSYSNNSDGSFGRLNKRFGSSSENLLLSAARRPNHLQIQQQAYSSGDSLDVEVRDHKDLDNARSRKSRSMMAPKNRLRSPVPTPRTLPPVKVILDGPVKRTRFSEGGKKCRKHWQDSYMVLIPTALYFYKDQKSYLATKIARPPGTSSPSSSPDLVLSLQNAHIVPCIQNHTKRYTRSLILTVGYDQYLIQTDTEEAAKKWMKKIQDVYYDLGPPRGDELPIQYQSSNTDLESLGRTPPVSRHSNRSNQKAGGSSNEDLSDSTELSLPKSHVRRKLRNFFLKRPTMDSLVKKGIYQEEPVFGRKLEEVCPISSPRVPNFVRVCVQEIERCEDNMKTDGLYRASGNLSQVQKIRLEVDQNNLSVIENCSDIHVLTGSLKLFFRELKEPLIPCSLFDRILAACSIKPREAKIKEFRDIVHALPQCNRDTLKFLLEHLLRVTKHSESNRMHTANLAIVFGPTLLWAPAEQAHNIAIDCIQQNHVVEILLNEFKDIFSDDGKGKKKT